MLEITQVRTAAKLKFLKRGFIFLAFLSTLKKLHHAEVKNS
jgi:hypothetical protein